MLEYLSHFNLVTAVIRILLAGICGLAIGLERTKRSKEAGIRTHCIIAMTAAVLMMVSKYAFVDQTGGLAADGTSGADPARIAAGIVSGISFLGAGVIFRNGNSVKGLTTAAGIWGTAAVGMCLGSGLYWIGLILAVLIVIVQYFFHKINIGCDAFSDANVQIVAEATPSFKEKLYAAVDEHKMQIQALAVKRSWDGSEEYEVTVRVRQDYGLKEIDQMLTDIGEIRSVSVKY